LYRSRSLGLTLECYHSWIQ